MRQAGYRPQNHDSGVYWIRAMGGKNQETKHEQSIEERIAYWVTLIILFGFSAAVSLFIGISAVF